MPASKNVILILAGLAIGAFVGLRISEQSRSTNRAPVVAPSPQPSIMEPSPRPSVMEPPTVVAKQEMAKPHQGVAAPDKAKDTETALRLAAIEQARAAKAKDLLDKVRREVAPGGLGPADFRNRRIVIRTYSLVQLVWLRKDRIPLSLDEVRAYLAPGGMGPADPRRAIIVDEHVFMLKVLAEKAKPSLVLEDDEKRVQITGRIIENTEASAEQQLFGFLGYFLVEDMDGNRRRFACWQKILGDRLNELEVSFKDLKVGRKVKVKGIAYYEKIVNQLREVNIADDIELEKKPGFIRVENQVTAIGKVVEIGGASVEYQLQGILGTIIVKDTEGNRHRFVLLANTAGVGDLKLECKVTVKGFVHLENVEEVFIAEEIDIGRGD